MEDTHTHTNTTFIQETGNLHETPTSQPTQSTSGTRLSIHVIFLQLRGTIGCMSSPLFLSYAAPSIKYACITTYSSLAIAAA